MKIRRLLIFAVAALAATFALRFAVEKASLFGSISGHTTTLKGPIPAYTRSLRPNFPYSIIPGGAYSPAELRYADQEDEVVKKHYADFDVKHARMVQLTEDKYQYASYRLKQHVYWTKKRLRIPRGEILLTDGSSFARARCGNRLSEKPHAEVSNEEPSLKALSLPPMQLGVPMELAATPPLGDLSLITPVTAARLQPVLPATGEVAPPGMPPFVPVFPIVPVTSIFPPPFAPPSSPPGSPPSSPPATPPTIPPYTPPLIPPETPPISSVPEPRVVYLFLVAFVLSLYGLTRMAPGHEKKDVASEKENL